MPIQALPHTTVRTIGATQVLTTPVSLVKELLDNALDARASSVSIEISANTLDIIQVRDNGHGIAPDDRALVAKRYCTSKIRNEQDLARIGGSSLGFRGEALSSAVEISNAMTITTRVAGEDVASLLCFNKDGSIRTQDAISHPLGTTVRLVGFLEAHSVRKKTMKRDASRTLVAIKHLLQSYAFSRPRIRLSFKVLKPRSTRNNWTYAAKSDATLIENAIKIVTKECISQCAMHDFAQADFSIRAILPSRDAQASLISGVGQFISVDGRPMSSIGGIGHRIAKLYKDFIRKSGRNNPDAIRDPFLYLSISCPPGSYDANVEPAKDDLLFEDEAKLLSLIRHFMAPLFPEREISREIDAPNAPTESLHERLMNEVTSRQSVNEETFFVSDDDLDMSQARPLVPTSTLPSEEDDWQAMRKVEVSNPWTLAKVNTLGRRAPKSHDDSVNVIVRDENDAISQVQDAIGSTCADTPGLLPTPEASSPTPRRMRCPDNQDFDHAFTSLPISKRPVTILEHMAYDLENIPPRTRSQITHGPDPCTVPPKQGTPTTRTPSLSQIPNIAPRPSAKRKRDPQQFVNKPFKQPRSGIRNSTFQGERGCKVVYETCEILPAAQTSHGSRVPLHSDITSYMQPINRNSPDARTTSSQSAGHGILSERRETQATALVARNQNPRNFESLRLERVPCKDMLQGTTTVVRLSIDRVLDLQCCSSTRWQDTEALGEDSVNLPLVSRWMSRLGDALRKLYRHPEPFADESRVRDAMALLLSNQMDANRRLLTDGMTL